MLGSEFVLASADFKSSGILAAEPEFLLLFEGFSCDGEDKRSAAASSAGGFLGSGSRGESAIDLLGACSCLLTATEVWGADTVLKVATEERDGGAVNSWILELDWMALPELLNLSCFSLREKP